MGDTSIRVSDKVKQRLDLFKREGESYNDVLIRLTERDKWAGFGALSDSDTETRDGMVKIREAARERMDSEIEDST